MPIIKNNQYTKVILPANILGRREDGLLKNKYYRYWHDGRAYITYQSKFWIIIPHEISRHFGVPLSYIVSGEVITKEEYYDHRYLRS
jgi:hypothetical protein